MSTEIEVRLLTLLNVAAIKKPRQLDIPGGHRGSPSLRSRSTSENTSVDASPAVSAPSTGGKKRKSVVFGGELGPSGSTFGKKVQGEKGKGKGKGKEVNGNVNGNGNGDDDVEMNGNGHHVELDVGEGSDDENATVSSESYKHTRI
jgi:U3 small nucleolar RNA-associated protein 25